MSNIHPAFWVLIGFHIAAACCTFMYTKRLRELRRHYDHKLNEQSARLTSTYDMWQRRYLRLRKILGLPHIDESDIDDDVDLSIN